MKEKEFKILSMCNNRFALDLLAKLWASRTNLLYSPYNIAAVCSMAYAGAHENTEKQIAKSMHFELEKERIHHAFSTLAMFLSHRAFDDRRQILTANAIWLLSGRTVHEDFRTLISKEYGARIVEQKEGDSLTELRKEINDWISDKTNGMIRDMIGQLSSGLLLVIVSAIYFQGNWANTFSRKNATKETFHITATADVTVPMMKQSRRFR